MKRRRILTEDERRLWERVNRTTVPHRPGKKRSALRRDAKAAEGPSSDQPVAPKPARAKKSADVPLARPRLKPLPQPPVAAIDRRTRARLGRGHVPIEAQLDLHGLFQQEAHTRLSAFLADCRRRRLRHVLIITGKGGRTGPGRHEPSGILRRSVPEWLGTPPMSANVVAIDVAAPKHGGTGAYYVTLRTK